MSRVSTHGTPRRGNGITEIAENSVSQALTEQSGRNVYSLVPDVESEISPRVAADPESAAFMATNLQKAAETSLPSTSPFSRRGGHGNDYRHISVTALPGPGLPRGGTCDTCSTRSRLATLGHGQRSGQSDPYFNQSDPSLKTSGQKVRSRYLGITLL
jgi:hypothetical protein